MVQLGQEVHIALAQNNDKTTSHGVCHIDISEDELSTSVTSPDTVQEALEAFHRDGALVLSNVIHHDHLDHLRVQMMDELPQILEWSGVQYNQNRSARNVSQCPPLSSEFMYKDIWANSHALSVIERLIGPNPQMVYVGGNTALPYGSDRQQVHSDVQPPHPNFIFGVEVNVFLDAVSASNGVTELWLGSHNISKPSDLIPNCISKGLIKINKLDERRLVSPPVQPKIAKGSIMLRDLRLWHSGMPNPSSVPRIMLGFIFFPAWYRSPMRLELPISTKPIIESWTSVDLLSSTRFVKGPIDHLRLPFGLNLTQRADGTGRLLTTKTEEYVKNYMSQYDISHNWEHIVRVANLAKRIATEEQLLRSDFRYDGRVVTLAAFLHDVGDHKYLEDGENGSALVESFLLQNGTSVELAQKIQAIVSHVSYSAEMRDPIACQEMIEKYPELAIVQDADRLDAIGAIGIGRCFAFAGSKGSHNGMKGPIEHFREKLHNLEGMMKTKTGRRLASRRTERLKIFESWWEAEADGRE